MQENEQGKDGAPSTEKKKGRKARSLETVKPKPSAPKQQMGYMLKVKPITETEVEALRRLIISGDLRQLTEAQRDHYYVAMCDLMGVDWRLKPFDYITLDGKLTLYAKASLCEQLRKNNRITVVISDRKQVGDIYIVTARAEMNGRIDEASGAVSIKGKGETALANLYMKAETKAKRRVTLSICGAGMLDESETDDALPGADLPPSVRDHLFGPRKEPLPPVAEAVAEDDANRQKIEDEAKAREAKVLTTIEKWKKTAEGKDAMSICLRLGYGSKSQMYEAFEKCECDFENFYSWLRDEWKKKQEK